jgi:hypothetical protein
MDVQADIGDVVKMFAGNKPGDLADRALYPLRELGSDIEALRFYEPIANARFQFSVHR